jgi:hypothetical protein
MRKLPPPRVDRFETPRGELLVVRGDLLAGGAKRWALTPLMDRWPEEEFVFGGPAQGYAQLALAYSAADVGKLATFFVAKRRELHPLTREAQAAGARIIQVPAGRLSVVQRRAKDYAEAAGAKFCPLGFDLPEMVEEQARLARSLGLDPPEVWATAGTGCLSRSLQAAWPSAQHVAVQIGFPPRIGAARLLTAPESFDEIARRPPPFPSCANYDAKSWEFIEREAQPGALFWNVAA